MPRKPLSTAARLWWLVGLTFLLLVSAYILVTRDIAPIDDSDLALPEREIDPAKNPYPDLRNITLDEDAIERIDKARSMLDGDEFVDAAFLDSLLLEFTEDLKRMERYASMDDWQNDQKISITTTLEHLSPWVRLAALKRVQIARLLENGDSGEAVDSAVALLKFGLGLQQSPASLVQFVFSSAILDIGHRSISDLILSGRLDASRSARLAEELREIMPSDEAFADTLRTEYLMFKQVIEDTAREGVTTDDLAHATGLALPGKGRVPSGLVLKPNRTTKLLADSYRQLIVESVMIRKDAPGLVQQEIEALEKRSWQKILSGNSVGYTLHAIGLPNMEPIAARYASCRATHRLLLIQLAIYRYRQQHSQWPPDLVSLVPEFLDTVPIDPMDGQSLRYDPNKKVVYSIGIDFLDQGGVAPDKLGSLKSRKEIVIELEPEETP